MTALLIVAWIVVGIVSQVLIVSWMNNHGDGLIRDPVLEVVVGATFGPFILACFIVAVIVWKVSTIVGNFLYRLFGVEP